uniref:hypothetical protein n=1 Tax=Pseudomonas viridiflava TaxID=33069 RepID=UPI0013CF13E6|nr:hypothetical protein [Pseudomonas viridiflava]
MIVPDVVPNVFDDLDPAAQGAKMELSQSNAMFFLLCTPLEKSIVVQNPAN